MSPAFPLIAGRLFRSLLAAAVLAALVINGAGHAGSQPPAALVLAGHFGGQAGKLVVSGRYAYLASGPELTILDVAAPSNPHRVGYAVAPGMIRGLVVQGQTVIVAWSHADDLYGFHYSGGVTSYDVSNSGSPVEVNSSVLPGGASGLALSGHYLYALWFTVVYNAHDSYTIGGLQVFDIAGSRFTAVGELTDYFPNPTGIAIGDGYAYLITSSRLYTLSLENPAQPQPVRDDFWGGAGIALAGSTAYVASASVFYVLSLADPAQPQQAGFLAGFARLTDVKVQGHSAYVSETGNYDGNTWVGGGLHVIDVANPANPVNSSYFPIPYGSQGVDLQNDTVYVSAGFDGLRLLRPGLFPGLRQVGAYRAPGAVDGLALDDRRLFTLTGLLAFPGTNGLRSIDLSTPGFPVEGDFIGIEDGRGIAIDGSRAYVPAGSYANNVWTNTLQVVDISDTGDLQALGSYKTTSWRSSIARIAARQGCVYIANDQSLLILDARNPADISVAGQITATVGVVDVAIQGQRLFVVDTGLRIFDLSDPANPAPVGSLAFADTIFQVALWGGYAYVSGAQGLHVVDVSDPAHPVEAGYLALPDAAIADIAAEDGYVFLAGSSLGVAVVDATLPSRPVLMVEQATAGPAAAVDIRDGYVYVAERTAGLSIWRFNPLIHAQFLPLVGR